MATLERITISDCGKPFYEECCTLEGDDPLIFTATEVLERIEERLNQNAEKKRVEKNMSLVLRIIAEGLNAVREPTEYNKCSVTAAEQSKKVS